MSHTADENFPGSEPAANPTAKDGSSTEPTAGGPGATSLVRNATGPRTQEGKNRSKYNSIKHGIFSEVVLMDGESRAEFNALLKGLRDDFRPEGTFQELQVEKLAVLYWRERRLVIADRRASSLPEFFGGPQQLDLALRYDATLNRNIDRTLAQFERHQRMRLGQPVPPPINLNITASKE